MKHSYALELDQYGGQQHLRNELEFKSQFSNFSSPVRVGLTGEEKLLHEKAKSNRIEKMITS